MLQYFWLIDQIVLHQVCSGVIDGHGVSAEYIMPLDLERVPVFEQARDDLFVDLFDDPLDEVLILVDPNGLSGSHPGFLDMHSLYFNLYCIYLSVKQ